MLNFVSEVVPGGDSHQDVCLPSQVLPPHLCHKPRYCEHMGLIGFLIEDLHGGFH